MKLAESGMGFGPVHAMRVNTAMGKLGLDEIASFPVLDDADELVGAMIATDDALLRCDTSASSTSHYGQVLKVTSFSWSRVEATLTISFVSDGRVPVAEAFIFEADLRCPPGLDPSRALKRHNSYVSTDAFDDFAKAVIERARQP
jgi:hypothetical protein